MELANQHRRMLLVNNDDELEKVFDANKGSVYLKYLYDESSPTPSGSKRKCQENGYWFDVGMPSSDCFEMHYNAICAVHRCGPIAMYHGHRTFSNSLVMAMYHVGTSNDVEDGSRPGYKTGKFEVIFTTVDIRESTKQAIMGSVNLHRASLTGVIPDEVVGDFYTISDFAKAIKEEFRANFGCVSLYGLGVRLDGKLAELHKRFEKAQIPSKVIGDDDRVLDVRDLLKTTMKEGGEDALTALIEANLDKWSAMRGDDVFRECYALARVSGDVATLLFYTYFYKVNHAVVYYDLRHVRNERPTPGGDEYARVVTLHPSRCTFNTVDRPDYACFSCKEEVLKPGYALVYADGRTYVHLPFMSGPILC